MNDCRAILNALGDGQMEAHELRHATGLDHERLYAALAKLDALGLAQMDSTRQRVAWEAA
jgi:DNA-binding IclR family transcriptional regulator